MNTTSSSWLVALALNLLLWGLWLVIREPPPAQPRALFPAVLGHLQVENHGHEPYTLEHDHGHWYLVIDYDGGAWRHAINRHSLTSLKNVIVHGRAHDPINRAQALASLQHQPHVPATTLTLNSHQRVSLFDLDGAVLIDFHDDGPLWRSDHRDLSLFLRPAVTWRLRDLDLPNQPERIQVGEPSLIRQAGRWWWKPTATDPLGWLESDLVQTWWDDLADHTIQGYSLPLPSTTKLSPLLQLTLNGGGRQLRLSWHRDHSGTTIVRRQEKRQAHEVVDFLTISQPPMTPDPLAWQPRQLLALPPAEADTIRLRRLDRPGDWTLTRNANGHWHIPTIADADSESINAFLTALSHLPMRPVTERQSAPVITLSNALLSYSVWHLTDELRPYLDQLPDILRSRRIAVANLPAVCLAIVISEGDLEPTIIKRETISEPWSSDDNAAIEHLLALFAEARLTDFHPPTSAPPNWDSVLTLRLYDPTTTKGFRDLIIQLAASGNSSIVGLPQRNIIGTLDAATHQAWFGP